MNSTKADSIVRAVWFAALAFLAVAATFYLYQVVDYLGTQAGIEPSWFTSMGKGGITGFTAGALFFSVSMPNRRNWP